MSEPAIDLGIVTAVVSSFRNVPVDEKTLVFGEIGLSGEVRSVSMAEQRIGEAAKLGFTTCILPKSAEEMLRASGHIPKAITLKGVSSVREAIGAVHDSK